MKLTVKLDYACRALAGLARAYASGEPVRIEDLARAEEISPNYLAQILGELRGGGLVESRRGKQGGYLLARAPETITLREIVGIAQGDLLGSPAKSGGASGKAVAAAWTRFQKGCEEAAGAITLRDLAAMENREMYYI